MAPRNVFRQQFNGNGPPDGFDGFGNNNRSRLSKWAIIGICIAVGVILLAIALFAFMRIRSRRGRAASLPASNAGYNMQSQAPPKDAGPAFAPPAGKSSVYGGAAGYGASPDQNQSLLGHAGAPAIVAWDADQVGSTQNGFGYNNANSVARLQRPASVASFGAPPPRYEEALSAGSQQHKRNNSDSGRAPLLLGQGEAASYYNNTSDVDAPAARGRSTSRGAAADNRRLSVDARSINGDRRRSVSRFRELEDDIDLGVSGNR
jgi:hypothetical protein